MRKNFGICMKTCYVTRFVSSQNQNCVDSIQELLYEGALVEFINKHQKSLIHPHFAHDNQLIKSDYYYEYDSTNFRSISEKMYQILLAVKDSSKRISYVISVDFPIFIEKIRIGSRIELFGVFPNKIKYNFWAYCGFIGEVSELGPGLFYGLVFMDESITVEPVNELPRKYLKWNPMKSIIAGAELFLTPIEIIKMCGVDPYLQSKNVNYTTRWDDQPKRQLSKDDICHAIRMKTVLDHLKSNPNDRNRFNLERESQRRSSLPVFSLRNQNTMKNCSTYETHRKVRFSDSNETRYIMRTSFIYS